MKLLAILATATTLIPWGETQPYETYYATLKAQCPMKRLEWLAPSILQEELLLYPISGEARRRMETGWRTRCPEHGFDSGCGNAVAMHVLIEEGQFSSFVSGLCRSYRACAEVALCERRSPAPAR
ncbi:hypothetical protein [Phenylobacterium sp.]|uniref:hypothetical protein n=1 Tax=Phenylobacterium sp. TaxID=1871053 RepID=UPI00301DD947